MTATARWTILLLLLAVSGPLAAGAAPPQPSRQAASDPEADAIRAAALDYIEGWYTGDAERMRRALHPRLAKRIVMRAGEDPPSLEEMDAETLIAATAAGHGTAVPEADRVAEVHILDRFEGAASVRVDATRWVDYLHLARWQGRWVIVNVLWELRPGVGR